MVRRGKLRRESNASLANTDTTCQDPAHAADKSCTCDVESRWLDSWLCVPCFNNDIFSAPTHDAYRAPRSSMAGLLLPLACQQGVDVGAAPTNNNTAMRESYPKKQTIDQCNLCDKRLRYFDSARKGRCLAPAEESERRKQLRYMAKVLQRELPATREVKAASSRRSRRGSWPRTRYFRRPALPERRVEPKRARRGSEAVIGV
jgi:hypothetical protein